VRVAEDSDDGAGEGVGDGARGGGDAVPGDGRDETEAERNDRRWDDILQELRVIQTGAQLTGGFLLTLPFQQRFSDLTHLQRNFYLGLVVLAGLVVAQVLTPIAIHRRLAGRQVKGTIVSAAQVALQSVLVSLSLLLVGTTAFVFDVVLEGSASVVAGVGLGAALVGLLLVLPRTLVK
jgi:hypothetical protein